jgi:hypothetical protein
MQADVKNNRVSCQHRLIIFDNSSKTSKNNTLATGA